MFEWLFFAYVWHVLWAFLLATLGGGLILGAYYTTRVHRLRNRTRYGV